jgi:surface carbohydrate biosynthesis protein (TIGR04326 family)
LNVLSDYNNLSKRKADIKSIKNSFRIKNSKIDLWPLLKNDWQNSLKGKISMSNCLTINLIEGTLSKLPPQKLGVYLQENISWEMAFIHIWKALGHGYLIGVPHSTVRFGDYRFYYDSRSYFNNGNNNLPLPDKVALNGPVAMKAYHDGNYPEEKMIEVEALRYLHLEEKNSCKNKNIDTFKLSSDLCVLVCGDYMPKVSKQIMLWLESAVKELPPNVHYIVKPHPSCPIMANDYPSLNLEMTNAPLVELLPKCDVVFTSNGTAAAVEAYCSGIPVIQVLDGNTFNLSPLHGLKGVEYVTNPMELAEVLQNVRKLDGVIIEPYFCLDNDLPRWKKLLDLIDL